MAAIDVVERRARAALKPPPRLPLSAWIERNLGPVGKLQDAGAAIGTLAKFTANLPRTLVRTERTIEKLEEMIDSGVEFSDDALRQLGDVQRRANRLGHLALWALVAIAAVYFLH